ncbi:hypothetical protein EJP67_18415 [Variovorax guangxiensis]|uniref:Uncharacterized protein n=1 Tax=Variovorax guangxiensis TaxID=1775474 RepID=A0A3S0ZG01_9BURK|nr:hypothetical protein [Variovorax guangxiensis]RUR69035.1 hypothetical protein EJP67_18415 [Variovorax guangxiensis]
MTSTDKSAALPQDDKSASETAARFTHGMSDKSAAEPDEEMLNTAADIRKLIESAPENIWLDLGENLEALTDDATFRNLSEVTWSEDNATSCGIKYIRADLPPADPGAVAEDLELVRSVLRGYPASFARADALKALENIQAALASPLVPASEFDEAVLANLNKTLGLTDASATLAMANADLRLRRLQSLHLTAPAPSVPSASLTTPSKEPAGAVAVRAGWNACIRNVFSLTDQTADETADKAGDFERGRRFEAKCIARAMNAFGPDHCEELRDWFAAPGAAIDAREQEPVISVEDSLRTRLRWSQEKVEQLEHENRELRGRLPGPSFDDLMACTSGNYPLASRPEAPTASTLAAEPEREAKMVVLERDDAGTPTVWCDPEIADVVSALNAASLRTAASCSGHGHLPGWVSLQDGREILIARSAEERDRMMGIFGVDINGEIVSRSFTNELGNAIRITIEGPTSVSENVLTPMEADQLRSALNERAKAAEVAQPKAGEA